MMRTLVILYACVAALSLALPDQASAQAGVPVVATVADFDNLDTSGESGERAAAHAERVGAFAEILRQTLAGEERFEVIPLACAAPPCTPGRLRPAKLIEAARDSGARVLIYGGVQKMSTLVQFGFVEAIDLKTDRSVFKQAISFRGDTDEAFRRAATYVAGYLNEVAFEP